jgi:chloramphenicol-sensitive protein RarD
MLPLYWPLLKRASTAEILARRVLWSFVFVVGFLALRRHYCWVPQLLRHPKTLAVLCCAGLTVGANWDLYIWAVNNGHAVAVRELDLTDISGL